MRPNFTNKVQRHILVKCEANRGGRYLVPLTIQEIQLTPDDPDLAHHPISDPSPYFGDFHEPLKKRGDLVTLSDGFSNRITRDPHVGKSVRPGRNGKVFVQFACMVPEWKTFTRRTEDPKLAWLETQCAAAGLRVVREGHSFHAPVSYVHRDDYEAAWEILTPIDDVPDDAPQFTEWAEENDLDLSHL